MITTKQSSTTRSWHYNIRGIILNIFQPFHSNSDISFVLRMGLLFLKKITYTWTESTELPHSNQVIRVISPELRLQIDSKYPHCWKVAGTCSHRRRSYCLRGPVMFSSHPKEYSYILVFYYCGYIIALWSFLCNIYLQVYFTGTGPM